MTLARVLFYMIASFILGTAVLTVTSKRIVHSALYLFLSLLAVGMIYLLLGSQFLAGMQVFIYAGAITVLMLFVVMLTAGEVPVPQSFLGFRKAITILAAGAFFLLVVRATYGVKWAAVARPGAPTTADLASILFQRYVVPFELSAIVLTIALIGAIVLAREEWE